MKLCEPYKGIVIWFRATTEKLYNKYKDEDNVLGYIKNPYAICVVFKGTHKHFVFVTSLFPHTYPLPSYAVQRVTNEEMLVYTIKMIEKDGTILDQNAWDTMKMRIMAESI